MEKFMQKVKYTCQAIGAHLSVSGGTSEICQLMWPLRGKPRTIQNQKQEHFVSKGNTDNVFVICAFSVPLYDCKTITTEVDKLLEKDRLLKLIHNEQNTCAVVYLLKKLMSSKTCLTHIEEPNEQINSPTLEGFY